MTWLCELSEPSYRWGMANRWSKQAWDEKHARAVLERWQRSGLSLREFARRQGISGAKLQYWKGRLLGAQARRRPGFISVPVVGEEVADDSGAVEVRHGRTCIRATSRSSARWVAQLLVELERMERSC